jgi:hypothetical protein
MPARGAAEPWRPRAIGGPVGPDSRLKGILATPAEGSPSRDNRRSRATGRDGGR